MKYYKNENISFNNEEFRVLDVSKLDFSSAKIGIKNTLTKVVRAKGGERIETKNKSGKIESICIANVGDAIFCNNDIDIYIPSDSADNRWKFDKIESYGYDIIESYSNHIIIRSKNKALLLFNVIKEPTCIKDAWGEGAHQFLYKGAVLKKDLKSGKVTGIDKDAFEKTWIVLKDEKN